MKITESVLKEFIKEILEEVTKDPGNPPFNYSAELKKVGGDKNKLDPAMLKQYRDWYSAKQAFKKSGQKPASISKPAGGFREVPGARMASAAGATPLPKAGRTIDVIDKEIRATRKLKDKSSGAKKKELIKKIFALKDEKKRAKKAAGAKTTPPAAAAETPPAAETTPPAAETPATAETPAAASEWQATAIKHPTRKGIWLTLNPDSDKVVNALDSTGKNVGTVPVARLKGGDGPAILQQLKDKATGAAPAEAPAAEAPAAAGAETPAADQPSAPTIGKNLTKTMLDIGFTEEQIKMIGRDSAGRGLRARTIALPSKAVKDGKLQPIIADQIQQLMVRNNWAEKKYMEKHFSLEKLKDMTPIDTKDPEEFAARQKELAGYDPKAPEGEEALPTSATGAGADIIVAPQLVLDQDLEGDIPKDLRKDLSAAGYEQRLAFAKKQAAAQKAKEAEEKVSKPIIDKLKDQESQAKLENKLGEFFNKLEDNKNPQVSQYIKSRKDWWAKSQYSEEVGGFPDQPYGDYMRDLEKEDPETKKLQKGLDVEDALKNRKSELDQLRGMVTFQNQEGKTERADPIDNTVKWAAAVTKMNTKQRNDLATRVKKVLSHMKKAGIDPKPSDQVDAKKMGSVEYGEARRGHQETANLKTEFAFLLHFNAREAEKNAKTAEEFKKAYVYASQANEALDDAYNMGSKKIKNTLNKHRGRFRKHLRLIKAKYHRTRKGEGPTAALQEKKNNILEWWNKTTPKKETYRDNHRDNKLMEWWNKTDSKEPSSTEEKLMEWWKK